MPATEELRALIRDERALAEALEFDQATETELENRLEDLLETIDQITHDEDLWRRLEQAEPLSIDDQDRVDLITSAALPHLLRAGGYRCPPPPPAEQFVEDTMAALLAARAVEPPMRAERVRQARWYFITFTMRVRTQLGRSREAPIPTRRSTIRSLARGVCRVARTLVPVLAHVAAGAIIATIPFGPVAFAIPFTHVLLQRGIEIGASALIGWFEGVLQDSDVQEENPLAVNPARGHLLAILDRIGPLRDSAIETAALLAEGQHCPEVLTEYTHLAAEIARHARRVRQILETERSNDLPVREACLELTAAANTLTEPAEALAHGADHAKRLINCLAEHVEQVIHMSAQP